MGFVDFEVVSSCTCRIERLTAVLKNNVELERLKVFTHFLKNEIKRKFNYMVNYNNCEVAVICMKYT